MLAHDLQLILDAICIAVGKETSPLFVGWSIGQREAVATVIADILGMDVPGINDVLQELIDNGFLSTNPHIPESYSGKGKEHLGITHEGWQRWSHFSDAYLSDWNVESLDEWWDSERVPADPHPFPEVFTFVPTKPVKQKIWRSIFEN